LQTLYGIRFLPVLRVRGIDLGLDARWLSLRGWGLVALIVFAALATPAVDRSDGWLAVRLLAGLSMISAVVLTTLGHELGHVLASRMVGLSVRAVVLAPHGGVTIRSGSDTPAVNFLTALAGPLANAIFAVACIWIAVAFRLDGSAGTFAMDLGALQLLAAIVNLLPCAPLDGQRMLAAIRAR
jgi:Zn-dependent protease